MGHFDLGLLEGLVRQGKALDALDYVERACDTGSADLDPVAKSYFGFLLASERGQVRRGLAICEQALQGAGQHAIVHLNAARAYLKARRKDEAIECLRAGLSYDPDNADLRAELAALGHRRPLLFRCLSRRHPLNRYLGLLAVRLRLRR